MYVKSIVEIGKDVVKSIKKHMPHICKYSYVKGMNHLCFTHNFITYDIYSYIYCKENTWLNFSSVNGENDNGFIHRKRNFFVFYFWQDVTFWLSGVLQTFTNWSVYKKKLSL